MQQPVVAAPVLEYRYSHAARRQAAAMLAIALVAGISLVWALAMNWSRLGGWTRIFGPLLVIIVGYTLRAQLGRLRYRLLVTAEAVETSAPLLHRRVPWSTITEVQRMRMPQLGPAPRWACTIYVPGRRGTPIPFLLFDNQLERADHALAQVIANTPAAQHRGIGEI